MLAGSGIRYVEEAAIVIAGNVTVIPSNVSGTRVTVVGVAPLATSSPIPDPVGAESPPAVAADKVSAAAGRCTGDCTVRVAMRIPLLSVTSLTRRSERGGPGVMYRFA